MKKELPRSAAVDAFVPIYFLLRTGRFEEVLQEIVNTKTGRIKNPYAKDPNHAWYVVGDTYCKTDQFVAAADAFRKSLRTRDNDCQALFALAYCYSELGSPVRATRVLLKVISIDGRKEKYLYNLGNAYFDRGRISDAIKAYEEVVASGGELSALATKNIAVAKKKLK